MEPTTPALATAPPPRDLRRRCRRPSSDGGKGTGKGAVQTYSCVPTWPFQGIKNYKVQLPSPEAETDSEPRPRASGHTGITWAQDTRQEGTKQAKGDFLGTGWWGRLCDR